VIGAGASGPSVVDRLCPLFLSSDFWRVRGRFLPRFSHFLLFFFVHQQPPANPKARPPRSPPKKQETSPSPTTGEVEGEWDGTTTLNNLNFRLMIVLHTVLQMRIRHYYIMKTMTLSENGETQERTLYLYYDVR